MKINIKYKDGKIETEKTLTKREKQYLEKIESTTNDFYQETRKILKEESECVGKIEAVSKDFYNELGKILKRGKNVFGRLEIKITREK